MDNAARLREAYKGWNDTKGQNHDPWMELMADDVVFRSLAGGAPGMGFTRDCTSKREVLRYFDGLNQDWEMIYYKPDVFISENDRVAMLGSCAFKNRRSGKTVETPKADFFLFKNGKIIEFFEFYDTAKALAGNPPV